MKSLRFILIPAVLFLLPGFGSAGWIIQPSGTTQWLMSVHFPVDTHTGYAVGGFPVAGTILKTTNGGANWDSLTSGTTNWLSSVHFPVDAQTGYVVGSSGTILKTINGGVTWVSQPSPMNEFLYSVQFPSNAQTGYAVGVYGTILKTTDGGDGPSFVEEEVFSSSASRPASSVRPNPFTSFATIPGHSSVRFALYDISGRRVGVYKGDRIGEGLRAGVYFLRAESGDAKPFRIVKVK